MAKNNNLHDFLVGLANKFRSVLGTTGNINPQDFEDKIQAVYDAGDAAGYSRGVASAGSGGPTGVTATAADVRAGKVFGSGGSATATGTAPEYAGVWIQPKKWEEQRIPAGSFLTGDVVFKPVFFNEEYFDPSMIRDGQRIGVGDWEDRYLIVDVTGSYSHVSSGQTALTASSLLSGYSGFANGGAEVKGSMVDYTSSYEATPSLNTSTSRFRLQIPNTGRYTSGNYLYAAYSAVATAIGLTAAKIMKGNTILGVAGTGNPLTLAAFTFNNSTTLSGSRYLPTRADVWGDAVKVSTYYATLPAGTYRVAGGGTKSFTVVKQGALTTALFTSSGGTSRAYIPPTQDFTLSTATTVTVVSSENSSTGGVVIFKV